jgi:hypothetical protein
MLLRVVLFYFELSNVPLISHAGISYTLDGWRGCSDVRIETLSLWGYDIQRHIWRYIPESLKEKATHYCVAMDLSKISK